jgi:DNA-binding FadR family transcriptional regulator
MKTARKNIIAAVSIVILAIAAGGYFCTVALFDRGGEQSPGETKGGKVATSGESFVSPAGKTAAPTAAGGETTVVGKRKDDKSDMGHSELPGRGIDLASLMDTLKSALEAGDNVKIQEVIALLIDCPGCLEELAETLADEAVDLGVRRLAAIALVKSGKRIMDVIEAIYDAVLLEDQELQENMLQALTYLDSPLGAVVLTEFIAGRQSATMNFDELPEEVQYACMKAIRMVPDAKAVGSALSEQYLGEDATEDEQQRLADISHPAMLANLVATAYEEGNTEVAYEFMDRLLDGSGAGGLHALMGLARNENIPIDDVISVLELWQKNHPDNGAQDHDVLVDYISRGGSDQAERIVAAYAMAGGTDTEMSVNALQKAYEYEEDPVVREHIEAALDIALRAEEQSQETVQGFEPATGTPEVEEHDPGASEPIEPNEEALDTSGPSEKQPW